VIWYVFAYLIRSEEDQQWNACGARFIVWQKTITASQLLLRLGMATRRSLVYSGSHCAWTALVHSLTRQHIRFSLLSLALANSLNIFMITPLRCTLRLLGRVFSLLSMGLELISNLLQRDCEALERLQKCGLQKKNPAASVVATLFGEGPDICWLAQNGPLLPISLVEKSSLKEVRFDESQGKAIEMGLDRKRPVVVIQGPPGTGKTSVVTELIERAVLRGERVLATAPTNAAVDNMVERLANAGLNVVRVGNPARVAPAVSSRSLSFIVDKGLTAFRRDLARRRADLRSDLRQCLDDDSVAAGIRQVLKQLSKTLKQREKEAIDDALTSAQVCLQQPIPAVFLGSNAFP
jgi:hypothetical protein